MTPELLFGDGRRLSLLQPTGDVIAIADIARALSRICRWNGHVSEFYSVAQHSVLVSECCAPGDALWGLLHDGSEAYLTDLPRPLKALPALAGYRALEAVWQRVIYQRFGLRGDVPASVHQADDLVLAWERRDLVDGVNGLPALPTTRLRGLRPSQAEAQFLARFAALNGGTR